MALIDMLQDLKGIDPDEKIKDGPDGPPATLRGICVMVLLGGDQRGVSEKDKLERFFLQQRITLSTKVELKAEDIVLLKKLVGESPNCGPLVYGRVLEILDPASMPKEPQTERADPGPFKKKVISVDKQ